MFDSEPVPFFQSPGQVNPRDRKYVVRKRAKFHDLHASHACSISGPFLLFLFFLVSHVQAIWRNSRPHSWSPGISNPIYPGSSFGFFYRAMGAALPQLCGFHRMYALPSKRQQDTDSVYTTTKTVLKISTNGLGALVGRRMYRTQETKRGVRQYTCVAEDEEKVKLLESRKNQVGVNWQRAVGREVFSVPVISKLVSPPAKTMPNFFFFLSGLDFQGFPFTSVVHVVAR